MNFDTEPDWMKKARLAPLYSTWESRQPPAPLQEGQARANNNPTNSPNN